jgi:hypothetical protein
MPTIINAINELQGDLGNAFYENDYSGFYRPVGSGYLNYADGYWVRTHREHGFTFCTNDEFSSEVSRMSDHAGHAEYSKYYYAVKTPLTVEGE